MDGVSKTDLDVGKVIIIILALQPKFYLDMKLITKPTCAPKYERKQLLRVESSSAGLALIMYSRAIREMSASWPVQQAGELQSEYYVRSGGHQVEVRRAPGRGQAGTR